MKPLLLLASLTVLQAQDLTGRWTGTAQTTDEAGTKRQESQTFEIKVRVRPSPVLWLT